MQFSDTQLQLSDRENTSAHNLTQTSSVMKIARPKFCTFGSDFRQTQIQASHFPSPGYDVNDYFCYENDNPGLQK